MKAIEEKILLYRVKLKKDPEAFAALYDEYVGPIYRYIFFKLSHAQEAEDTTSDVFLKAWQYLIERREEQIASFRQFIYTVARNCVIDVYRERVKKQTCSIDSAIELASPQELQQEIETASDVEQLFTLVKKLKQEYQDIVVLRYIEELSVSEIAVIMGKSQVSVRVTLHRAVKKLQALSGNQSL